MARLSVCIPNYNMAEWIDGAVRSALALEPPDEVEVVVVDNASTDNSAEVLAGWRGHSRVSVHLCVDHLSMVENWNRAVRLSSGEWCLLLSADDQLDPRAWAVARTELVSKVTAISLAAEVIEDSNIRGRQGYDRRTELDGLRFAEAAAASNPFPLLCTFFPRCEFDALGGFAEGRWGPAADVEFWARLLARPGAIGVARGEVGGSYYLNRGSTWLRAKRSGHHVRFCFAALTPVLAVSSRADNRRLLRSCGRVFRADGLNRISAGDWHVAARVLLSVVRHSRGWPRLESLFLLSLVTIGQARRYSALRPRLVRSLQALRAWATNPVACHVESRDGRVDRREDKPGEQ